MMRTRPRCWWLAPLGLFACGPEATSPCYAPAAYTYAGAVREVGKLPRGAYDVLALPDGRVFALTIEFPDNGPFEFSFTAYRFDPAAGAAEEVAAWAGVPGPIALLPDGRVLHFERSGCRYQLIDPDAPGSVEARSCEFDGFSAELMWPEGDGTVLLFGQYSSGGGRFEGAVLALDVAAATVVKYDTSSEYGFYTPPTAPFPLCDGRLVLPHTQVDGGDYFPNGRAVHYYDPAQRQLSALGLSFAPKFAAQLDARSALLLGEEDDEPKAAVLDLETQELTAVAAPSGVSSGVGGRDQLIGLADGSALAVDDDGGLHVFTRESGEFRAITPRFADAPRQLARLPAGPVLAFGVDGEVAIYE